MSERWKKNKSNINISILNFFYTVHLATLNMYTKFEDPGSNRSLEICDRILVGEKEKRTNKGTDKPYVVDSLLHNTTHHYRALCQISEY